MRTGVIVDLSPFDRERLQAIVDDRNTAQKHVWRARIVLGTADGLGTMGFTIEAYYLGQLNGEKPDVDWPAQIVAAPLNQHDINWIAARSKDCVRKMAPAMNYFVTEARELSLDEPKR